jgi:hypothetical protein
VQGSIFLFRSALTIVIDFVTEHICQFKTILARPMKTDMTKKKRYRFLSGPDDASFCQRVSDALAEGYVLYGDPVMVVCDNERICGQAVVLPGHALEDGDQTNV